MRSGMLDRVSALGNRLAGDKKWLDWRCSEWCFLGVARTSPANPGAALSGGFRVQISAEPDGDSAALRPNRLLHC